MRRKPENNRKRSRVLLHSQRSIFPDVHFRLGLYEFEDIIEEVDSVDIIYPEKRAWFDYKNKLAHRIANVYPVGINPGLRRVRVEKDYDLFLAVVQFPNDLLHIESVDGWRERSRTAVCWLNEVWNPEIHDRRYFLKLLGEFDYIILPVAGPVERIRKAVGKQCIYMPFGIDTVLFSPYPSPPRRVIDVYSIGRRAGRTHETLSRLSRENMIFYVYDTIRGERVTSPPDHRLLFANMAKRSRYFIANPGKADNPGETGGQVEFGNRFFEGAAAGTIMIGETPRNEKFDEVFDWEDAVVHLPYDSAKIDDVIEELDGNPERQLRIRTNNIVNSLLRHDWVYRWEEILKLAGLEPLPGLFERKSRLQGLAEMADKNTIK